MSWIGRVAATGGEALCGDGFEFQGRAVALSEDCGLRACQRGQVDLGRLLEEAVTLGLGEAIPEAEYTFLAVLTEIIAKLRVIVRSRLLTSQAHEIKPPHESRAL